MDNRNFNRKDNGFARGGVAEFLDKQGIYIIMLVCLALIGITAYFALGSGGNEKKAREAMPTAEASSQAAGANTDKTLEEEIKRLQTTPTPTVTPTATPKATPTATPQPAATAQMKAKTASAAVTKQEEVKARMPIDGEIIRPYSPEEPVFYATLNEWMVHTGIDIQADEGADIVCALDGTVESVKNDANTGYTVVIDHGNGIKTLYGNLASPDGVKEGQKVNRGDAIGKAGRSATNTMSDPAHVHFEYSKNGKRLNPEEACTWNRDL